MEERRKPVLGRVVPGVTPDLQRRLRRFFGVVQTLSPSLAAKLALRLFMTPPRRRLDATDAPVVAQAVRSVVPIGADSFTQWTWGDEAPVVVVLHGWGSHAARFGDFIAPLRAAGYRVVGIDAPAHGVSPGRQSDLPRFRDSLIAVLRAHRPVHAVIGHSLGGAATLTVLAETQEFHPGRICLFGVPADMDYILESFAMMLGLRPRAMAKLRERFERQFGRSARDISIAAAAPHVRIPTLVVHDEEDNVAPLAQGQALAAAIPHATMHLTKGLGHSGALRDAATIERVIAFLRA
ncbi:MAG TPA: alpha/beta fold hydrolase [Steroidobacteraceae bacterium]|nr:alpha/beta fold hydrolase [Steroidobacteraceae bacterium]